jgi:hypothetical protein
MMFFLIAFYCLKSNFLGLSNVPRCPCHHASQHSRVQKIYKIWKFSTQMRTISLIYFLWCLSTLFPTPLAPHVWMSSIAWKRKKIMSNLIPIVFSTCFFNTPTIASCHFVIGCQHSHFLLLPIFLPIFSHS